MGNDEIRAQDVFANKAANQADGDLEEDEEDDSDYNIGTEL